MRPIDPRRLARAVHLDVERLDRDRWRVTGGADPHLVVRTAEGLYCDCTDASMGRRRCKHMLAVKLAQGEPAVLLALRELVAVPEATTAGPAARSGHRGRP